MMMMMMLIIIIIIIIIVSNSAPVFCAFLVHPTLESEFQVCFRKLRFDTI